MYKQNVRCIFTIVQLYLNRDRQNDYLNIAVLKKLHKKVNRMSARILNMKYSEYSRLDSIDLFMFLLKFSVIQQCGDQHDKARSCIMYQRTGSRSQHAQYRQRNSKKVNTHR